MMEDFVTIEHGGDKIDVDGWFIYKDFSVGEKSLLAFYNDFCNGNIDFDDCIGTYRIVITKQDNSSVLFGDNSGSLFWFISTEKAEFFTSLSQAYHKGNLQVNYSAVAQFLWFGCIYGAETLVKDIVRSDPSKYYILKNGEVSSVDKDLRPFEAYPVDDHTLENYIQRVLKGINRPEAIGCTITGGMDSRSVLAHLINNGIEPALSITGHTTQADVDIAAEIANTLSLPLTVISDSPEQSNWIDKLILDIDGQASICGTYRLWKQFCFLKQNGIAMEFGGLAGEFYKNSFINQDYPFYFGRPNWKRFLKYKVLVSTFPTEICTKMMTEELTKIPQKLINLLSDNPGKTKANSYLYAGYKIIQARGATLNMMENHLCHTCNPLAERIVVAQMFHKNPYLLEMQAFQRKHVSRNCSAIKKIRTDRGLTCDEKAIIHEWFKSMRFLFSVFWKRVKKNNPIKKKLDPALEQGLSTKQYDVALQRAKQLGIIRESIKNEQIPPEIADRLFTIGTFFDRNENLNKEEC